MHVMRILLDNQLADTLLVYVSAIIYFFIFYIVKRICFCNYVFFIFYIVKRP